MKAIVETLEEHKVRLLASPGCTGVAIGYQTIGGEIIDRLAIIIFVDKKQPELPADQQVPREIDGHILDVVERSFGYTLTSTKPFDRFDPLISGISLTPREAPPAWGTLGCFVHVAAGIPGVPVDDYLLTNEHVLHHATPDDPDIIQPGNTGEPAPANYSCGSLVSSRRDRMHDCAIASVVGRSWLNEVPNHPWRPGRRRLAGIAVARVGDEVYKYGATTQSTRGVVRYVNFKPVGPDIANTIYIESADGSMWVATGDSGSVLIRYSDDFVVGLNFAADDKTMLRPDQHPKLPLDLPAYSAGYAYDIQAQMDAFGANVTLA